MSVLLKCGVRYGLLCGALALLSGGAMQANAAETKLTLTIRAVKHSYRNTPIVVGIPAVPRPRSDEYTALVLPDGSWHRCMIWQSGVRSTSLSFVLPELKQGEERTLRLVYQKFKKKPEGGVSFKMKLDDLEAHIANPEGKSGLFTAYRTMSGANKPFLYPILNAEGGHFTRRYPMEKHPGDTDDHPHHRGLWFTHGEVNGIDFWSESKKAGSTTHRTYGEIIESWALGQFETYTRWMAPDGKFLAQDRRQFRIYPLPNGDRILDFEIEIRPQGEPLTFGDTKEGMFGLRVAETLAPARKLGGHSVNAKGDKDGAIWGKAAEWVDYFGPINGKTYGVAIFDHPKNLRHPQTWHARDYGLFTVNPFGLHDFQGGKKGIGDYVVPANQWLTLRYRLVFHQGDPQAAEIADRYAAYADPPEVIVAAAK